MENTPDAPPRAPQAPPHAPVRAPVRAPAPPGGGDVELLTITEAARRVGVSRQALTRRVKRGTLRAHRAAIEGELVWRIPFSELARAYPEVGAAPGAAPVRTPPAPVHAPPTPRAGPSAELIVLRSDYRAMLVQVKEQAQAAEARELRARRALVPALVGLALAAVVVGVTWTGWHGASARAAELASQVPDLRARAEFLAGEVVTAKLMAGEGALALERSRFEVLEAQHASDLDLAGERALRVQVASELAVEHEARQRAEAVVLSPVQLWVIRRIAGWGIRRRVF